MRVLFTGPAESPVLGHLRAVEGDVAQTEDPLDAEALRADRPDFLVSHGYRHIIRPPVLELLGGNAVNLHISLLPWNRGADPNLWSWVDGTPKGVTIHYIDDGVDTGDIAAQRELHFDPDETLATSYEALQAAILELFADSWPAIRDGRCDRRPQTGTGTTHRTRDRERIAHLLTDGWHTPVARLGRHAD